MTRVKEKVFLHPRTMCQPLFMADPGGDRWISTASLKLTVEAAEAVQGVDDELPLRGISAMWCWYLRRSGRRDTRNGP